MPSKAQILAFLAKIISVGEVVAPITPLKLDDMLVSFLKWAQNDAVFLDWLERFEPPAPGAFTAPPEALVDAIRRWGDATGQATAPGKWMQLLQTLLELAAWFAKNKGALPA